MGHKVNPNGYRYGVNKNWQSRWIAKNPKETAQWIVQDEKVRNYIEKQYKSSQIVRIEIERTEKNVNVFIQCGQPGTLLGKEGANINAITIAINKIVGRDKKVNINVIPYDNIAWSAKIIAREIADAIENRVSFRNAQKQAIKKVIASKALGIKTKVSGRLGGVEMARTEGYSEGVIPMTTLRADLDYAIEEAHTTYGKIGVKVWIYRGEIFGKGLNNQIVPKKGDFKDTRKRTNFTNAKERTNKTSEDVQITSKSVSVKVGE